MKELKDPLLGFVILILGLASIFFGIKGFRNKLITLLDREMRFPWYIPFLFRIPFYHPPLRRYQIRGVLAQIIGIILILSGIALIYAVIISRPGT